MQFYVNCPNKDIHPTTEIFDYSIVDIKIAHTLNSYIQLSLKVRKQIFLCYILQYFFLLLLIE